MIKFNGRKCFENKEERRIDSECNILNAELKIN